MTVIRVVVGLMIMLTLSSGLVWAQNFAPESAVPVRVSLDSPNGGRRIGGYVHNDSSYWVVRVRLRVEGFDSAQRTVGERYVWAPADIPPGNRVYFQAPSLPGAASYRITVASYDLMTLLGAP